MNAKQLWQAALEQVRAHVTPASYTTWFNATVGCELQGATLTVAVPNAFACEHLRQRFHDLAAVAVRAAAGHPYDVRFIVSGPSRGANMASEPPPPRREEVPVPRVRSGRTGQRRERLADMDRPRTGATRASKRRAAIYATQPRLLPSDPRGAPAPPPAPLAPRFPATPAASHDAPDAEPRFPIAREALARALAPDTSGQQRFESFVVGTSNRLAYVAALQISAAPGATYNPLFIYGGPGLGKTHLLRAVAQAAHAMGWSVCYVTAEQFANEMIESIRRQRTEEFRARYRTVDVLLVDDVQFVAGKPATEEELLHTFNALHDAGRQIVLSSDRPPQAMRHLHDRLRSRFAWGLLADLRPPDAPNRLEILRDKAHTLNAPIDEDTLGVLAELDIASVRELEGMLNRVLVFARMRGEPATPETVALALAPLQMERPHELAAEAIIAAVAHYYGVTPAALRGKGRERAVAWPRQVAMYLLREETSASLGHIGQALGGRDHTTIMHGCAQVARSLATDTGTRRDLDTIRGLLRRA